MFKLPSSDFIPKFLSNIESWHGHVFFVRDLIHNMCPSIIVELGVHKGDSLFSMAQSCIESNLETKLYGIDHWEGDSQAGHFDSEVYNYVKEIKNDNMTNMFSSIPLIIKKYGLSADLILKVNEIIPAV